MNGSGGACSERKCGGGDGGGRSPVGGGRVGWRLSSIGPAVAGAVGERLL